MSNILTGERKPNAIWRRKAYYAWRDFMNRCHKPSHKDYPTYGAKGITVCPRWHEFENFLHDMGYPKEGDSIDRINPYGNYEPDNCRWATPAQKAINQRLSSANTSGFRCVRGPVCGGYQVIIIRSGKNYCFGTYRHKHLAAHVYNKNALKLDGDNAILNPVGSKEGVICDE